MNASQLAVTQQILGSTKNVGQVPIGQTSTISVNDLMKIRTQLAHADAESRGHRIMDDEGSRRKELHMKSKQRVKSWGNTLEARRMEKDKRRQAKFDEEEARRQVQDKQEASFQATQRREAIERAQRLLFDDTDRVKTFNSQLLLCDAMKEREYQIEIANAKAERAKRDEEMWHRRTMEKVAADEAVEAKKAEERRQMALTAKRIQTEQLEQVKQRIIKGVLDERHEGELIKVRALATEEEEERKEMETRALARQHAKQTLAETREMAAKKAAADAAKLAKEEATIAKFAAEKERKMELRKARMKEIEDSKLAARQKMIDRQYEYLMSLRTDEEKRLSDQIEKAERARAEAEAAKQARRAAAMAEGRAFNQAQLQIKAESIAQARAEGKVEAANLRQMFDEMNQKDLDEAQARRNKNVTLKKYHVKQMTMKERKTHQARLAQEAESQAIQAALDADERAFMHYAEQTIDQLRAEDKNVKPLQLEVARSSKPKMVSA